MATVAVMEIKAAGPLTTLQDLGRFGFARYGVAPSGALDSVAMRIANLLVDNPEEEAVLEITLPGFCATVLTDAVIAVTGADLGWRQNDRPLRMWQSHRFHRGEVIACRELHSGCRAYLSVGGGWVVPDVMGSKSTNLSSGFGGFHGRSLEKGDVLWSSAPQHHFGTGGRRFGLTAIPAYHGYWEPRVVLGPQDDDFSATSQDLFFNSVFRVSPHSDRTGIRLLGASITAKEGLAESILSEGVVAGAVQVPGDGRPIILLGETASGGYRKIATVITADLHLLGQVLPGDRIRFQAVTIREARQALRQLEEMIGRFRDSLA